MGVMDKVASRLGGNTAQVRALTRRVSELENEVQECRAINLRLAELCDVVAELLVPLQDRDTEAVDAVLARYRGDIESMGR